MSAATQTNMWRHQYAGRVRDLVKAKAGGVEDVAAALNISERRAWSLWLGKVEWTVRQLVELHVAFDIDLVDFFSRDGQDIADEVTC